MKPSEISRIERSVLIQAPRAKVWKALTDVNEFTKWLGVSADGPFVPGARVKMSVTSDDYAGMVFYVTIEKMEPMELFSWRWHPGSAEPNIDYSKEPMTLVEFRLQDEAAGTRVTVVESGFEAISLARRAKVFEENVSGWEYQMAALEKYVRESA